MCKCGSFADKDEETYYSELMDEIDKVMQPIVDKISPDLYFEHYLFRIQLDGYYILWIGISEEKKEIYIRAYHRDTHKRVYVVMAMDGHLTPAEEIELLIMAPGYCIIKGFTRTAGPEDEFISHLFPVFEIFN
ncbi:MAG: hypothetical protein K6E34_10815 [Lachnospiraceae bacterium]|nr:hypothetical protein [Lachnospiraceae bacterium]